MACGQAPYVNLRAGVNNPASFLRKPYTSQGDVLTGQPLITSVENVQKLIKPAVAGVYLPYIRGPQ